MFQVFLWFLESKFRLFSAIWPLKAESLQKALFRFFLTSGRSNPCKWPTLMPYGFSLSPCNYTRASSLPSSIPIWAYHTKFGSLCLLPNWYRTQTYLGSSQAWLFHTWLFAIFTRSFAPFCPLLRSFSDLRLRSFALFWRVSASGCVQNDRVWELQTLVRFGGVFATTALPITVQSRIS